MHNICLITCARQASRLESRAHRLRVGDKRPDDVCKNHQRARPKNTTPALPEAPSTFARCFDVFSRGECLSLSRAVQTLNHDTQFVLISGSPVGVETGGDEGRTQRHKLILLSQASAGVFPVDNHRESDVNSSFSWSGAIFQTRIRVLPVSSLRRW